METFIASQSGVPDPGRRPFDRAAATAADNPDSGPAGLHPGCNDAPTNQVKPGNILDPGVHRGDEAVSINC